MEKTVRYVVSSRKSKKLPGREWLCEVKIGNMEILGVAGGVTREQVKTLAAEMVVKCRLACSCTMMVADMSLGLAERPIGWATGDVSDAEDQDL